MISSQKVRIHDAAIYGLMDLMSFEHADSLLYSAIRVTLNLSAIISLGHGYIQHIFFPHTCLIISDKYIVAIFLARHIYIIKQPVVNDILMAGNSYCIEHEHEW